MGYSRILPRPGADTLDYGQVSVGTTATQILGKEPERIEVLVSNQSGTSVFLGDDASVTTSNGLELPSGQILRLEFYTGPLYGIVATGTATVGYLEVPA